MQHTTHGVHSQPASHHSAPGLPEVHDEAPNTPLWVPVLGLVLLVVVVTAGCFWLQRDVAVLSDSGSQTHE